MDHEILSTAHGLLEFPPINNWRNILKDPLLDINRNLKKMLKRLRGRTFSSTCKLSEDLRYFILK